MRYVTNRNEKQKYIPYLGLIKLGNDTLYSSSDLSWQLPIYFWFVG